MNKEKEYQMSMGNAAIGTEPPKQPILVNVIDRTTNKIDRLSSVLERLHHCNEEMNGKIEAVIGSSHTPSTPPRSTSSKEDRIENTVESQLAMLDNEVDKQINLINEQLEIYSRLITNLAKII